MGEIALSGYSYEEYLALEASSDTKYEYHDGFIVAMAGGTPEHGQIGTNFTRVAGNALINSGKFCIVYNSDVKVHIQKIRRSFYPDASIACGQVKKSTLDKNAITNPVLILEVLSEGNQRFDRGAKFSYYRQLDSLREYVLIWQTEAIVDTYYLTDDGTWEIKTYRGLDEKVLLKSIGCEVRMKDIYWLVPGIHQS